MKYEYGHRVMELINKALSINEETIDQLAEKFAETIENDKMIHTFGTGHSHMLGIELFARAGGLGNINAMIDPDTLTVFGARRSGAIERCCGVADVIFDSYKIEKDDIMIITSNSGRNSVPVEMAMRCKKEGVYCIALTNLEQSKNTSSRHPSGKKLYELTDCVIDNCLPEGDASMDVNGIKTGPVSSIVTMAIMNTIVTEAIKIVTERGKKPMVFQSQNVDGFNNDEIYEHYINRAKHL